MKAKHTRIALFIGAGILVVVGIIVAVGISQITKRPNFNNLLPEYSSPLQVKLLAPSNGGSFPADSSILVQASAGSTHSITNVELWINGKLFSAQKPLSADTTRSLFQWHFQPGVEGSYTLLARATDSGGNTSISTASIIQVTAALGYTELVTSQADDTIASVANKYGLTPEQFLQVNPQLEPTGGGSGGNSGSGITLPPLVNIDLNLPLPPKTTFFIPHMTAPFVIQDFSLGGSSNQGNGGSQGNPPPASPSDPAGPVQITFFDKLFFQINTSLHTNTNAPAAPTLSPDNNPYNACHPEFWVDRNSKDEDGYYVYRFSPNDPMMVRIDTLAKLEPGYAGHHYVTHDNITGVFTFVVSAFNTAGENFSNPLTFDLSKCDYTPGAQFAQTESTTGGVGMQNGVLTLPSTVNLAYLYIGINGTFWERVPPGSSNFLSGSGYQFDLNQYLGGLINTFTGTDLDVTIQVWGWQGGQVGLVGTYQAKIQRAVLTVCSQDGENQCQGLGGSAPWTGEVILPTDIPLTDIFYNLSMSLSPGLKSTKQIYQVSTKPYTGPAFNDGNGIFDSGLMYEKNSAILDFPMAAYYNDDPIVYYGWEPGYKMDVNALKALYPPGTPFTLYIRVIPIDKMGNVGLPSNVVIMHYQTPPDQSAALPIASNLPSLYTVEIIKDSYQPPVFINPQNWGCVTILNDAEGYTKGQNVCPPYRDTSSHNWDIGGLASGIYNGVANGIDALSALFEQAKDDIVNAVAGLIPGCGDTCKTLLKTGLNAGFTALTGLPPNIPNFDELAADGIDYIADQVQGTLTGYNCDQACMDALKGQLGTLVQESRQIESQPTCLADDQVAMFYGRQPGWCLPPDVQVEPYPGGSNQPGAVLVRITRNNTPTPAGDIQKQYFLDLSSQGTNDTRKGTYGNSCEYDTNGFPFDGHGVTPDNTYSFYQDQEQGKLFDPVRIAMPLLNPGESIVIPITLTPIGHDNTKDVYMPNVGCNGFANFEYLFYKGSTQITAAEYCFNANDGTTVPCTQGGMDTYNTVNPQDPSDQWP